MLKKRCEWCTNPRGNSHHLKIRDVSSEEHESAYALPEKIIACELCLVGLGFFCVDHQCVKTVIYDAAEQAKPNKIVLSAVCLPCAEDELDLLSKSDIHTYLFRLSQYDDEMLEGIANDPPFGRPANGSFERTVLFNLITIARLHHMSLHELIDDMVATWRSPLTLN